MANQYGISERLSNLERGQDRIEQKLNFIIKNSSKMFENLQAEVANNTTVESSAIALIKGLAAQITAAGTDPAALAAIVSTLQANDTALAAAVAANTVAAPTVS